MWTKETRCAYAAGIMDGEGHITIGKVKGKSFCLRIAVGQCTKGMVILQWLKEHFGGKISSGFSRSGNRQTLYQWFLSGKEVYDFLVKVRPLLVFKTEQADLAIRFFDMVGFRGRGKRMGETTREKCRQMYWQMRMLNKKGISYFSEGEPKIEKKVDDDLFSSLDVSAHVERE